MYASTNSFTSVVMAFIMIFVLAFATAVPMYGTTTAMLEFPVAIQEPIPETNPDEAIQADDPVPEEAIIREAENIVPKTEEVEQSTLRPDGSPNPIATIEMEDGGIIMVELMPVFAPNTVANFISLANSGFYDGLIFHRVIQEFMIQGGDPEGTGMGGCGYAIFGEFASNEFENNLSHQRGVISMARSYEMDSAGSQFFICVADADFLDGEYAAFGKVIDEESMAVVDAIVTSDTPNSLYASGVAAEDIKDADGNDMEFTEFNVDLPIFTQRIKTITVETFGEEFTVEIMPEPTYEVEVYEDEEGAAEDETTEEATEETTEDATTREAPAADDASDKQE